MAVDMDKLQEFLGRFVTDLGAAFTAGNVVTGHYLGLYRALAAGPARAAELAERTSTNPRYIAQWLSGQAAGGYVEYNPVTDTYSMTEEQAFALANPDGASNSRGVRARARHVEGRAADHRSVPHRRRDGLARARPECLHRLRAVLPPGRHRQPHPVLDPGAGRRGGQAPGGAKVADIGCGLGASAILLAQQYPNSRFTGSDYHDQSIEIARKHAADTGVADRISWRSPLRPISPASATTWPPRSTACTTWATHSAPPGTSARHSSPMAPGWSSALAADEVAGNLNPVGRVYYSASTQLCVPNALSQPGGYALGAGPARARSGR